MTCTTIHSGISAEIEATNPRVPREQIRALAYSTRVLNRLRRFDEADRRLTKAFDQLRAIKSYPSDKVEFGSEADAALSALADDHVVHGRVSEAIATYQYCSIRRRQQASSSKMT